MAGSLFNPTQVDNELSKRLQWATKISKRATSGEFKDVPERRALYDMVFEYFINSPREDLGVKFISIPINIFWRIECALEQFDIMMFFYAQSIPEEGGVVICATHQDNIRNAYKRLMQAFCADPFHLNLHSLNILNKLLNLEPEQYLKDKSKRTPVDDSHDFIVNTLLSICDVPKKEAANWYKKEKRIDLYLQELSQFTSAKKAFSNLIVELFELKILRRNPFQKAEAFDRAKTAISLASNPLDLRIICLVLSSMKEYFQLPQKYHFSFLKPTLNDYWAQICNLLGNKIQNLKCDLEEFEQVLQTPLPLPLEGTKRNAV